MCTFEPCIVVVHIRTNQEFLVVASGTNSYVARYVFSKKYGMMCVATESCP